MRTGGKTGGKRSAEPRVPDMNTSHSTSSLPSYLQQQQSPHVTDEKPFSAEHKLDLSKFRSLVRSYIDRGHYETAIFWADKISTLSGGEPKDVYWMAYALYQVCCR